MEFQRGNNREGQKKLISPYLIYVQERRETLREEQLCLTPQEIIAKLGEEWKNMTDEEKKPYIERAEANKMLRLAERNNHNK